MGVVRIQRRDVQTGSSKGSKDKEKEPLDSAAGSTTNGNARRRKARADRASGVDAKDAIDKIKTNGSTSSGNSLKDKVGADATTLVAGQVGAEEVHDAARKKGKRRQSSVSSLFMRVRVQNSPIGSLFSSPTTTLGLSALAPFPLRNCSFTVGVYASRGSVVNAPFSCFGPITSCPL
jgi:hypothetical protein